MAALTVPASLDDALRALAAVPDARPIAGGIGILLRRQLGEPPAERLVAIGALVELRAIEPDGETGLMVGSAATLAEVARSPLVSARAPLLAAAAAAAANPGVRTTATIGGNVLDLPAGSDLAAAALALDAEAVWASDTGARRRLAFADLLDERRNGAASGVLVGLRFSTRSVRWGFERLQTRGRGDRPTATVALALRASGDAVPSGTGGEAWATSIADRPVALRESLATVLAGAADPARLGAAVERDLTGYQLLGAAGARVAEQLVARQVALDGGAYRRRVLPVLLARAVTRARARQTARADA